MTSKHEVSRSSIIKEAEGNKLILDAPNVETPRLSWPDKFLSRFGVISVDGHRSILTHLNSVRVTLLNAIQAELNEWKLTLDNRYQEKIDNLEKKVCETELSCKHAIQEAFTRNGIVTTNNKTAQLPIVPSGGLGIEPYHIEVFSKHLAKNGIELSDEQEKVLYSNHRATNVLAGAGSGKSTVLSLRIVFMNKCLGIPLSSITVTTFTRESRKDFIKKLAKDFKIWGDELTERNLKSVVRTFHSVAYEVNKRFNADGRKLIFGDKTPKIDPDDEYGTNVENMYADDADQTVELDDSIDKMSEILIYVYKVTYSNDTDFRNKINQLYLSTLREKVNEDFSWSKVEYGLQYEDSIFKLLFKDWFAQYQDYFKQLPKDIAQPGRIKINGKYARYHLYLKNLDAKIFLGRPSSYFDVEVIPGTKAKIGPVLKARRSIIRNLATVNYLWVDSLDELKHLVHLNDYTITPMPETDVVPDFSYTLTGDIPNNKIKIYSQLHSLGQFAYSLGISLKEQSENKIKQYFSKCAPLDSYYVSAAGIFQSALEAELNVRRLITFDEIFHEFGNADSPLYENADVSQLSKVTHLLIDEFQDISPNIIKFITVLKQKKMGVTEYSDGSIICVGDDYQSIYGWRGSSPQFILDFKKCFPLQKEFCELSLINNYRSSEKILAKAKISTDLLKFASNKSYVAAGENAQSPDSEFRVFSEVPASRKDETCIDYVELTRQLSAEINYMAASKTQPIFLLYRTNALVHGKNLPPEWKRFFNQVIKNGQVKALTIHTSKGLEADSVFIVGDIAYSKVHPVKNALYVLGSMKFTYDFAQTEEAYRLGYVAITRAKKRVKWFLNSRSNPKSLGKIYFAAENTSI